MQKSSTVNFPSFLSAPYIAITLPEVKNNEMPCHTGDRILLWSFNVVTVTSIKVL